MHPHDRPYFSAFAHEARAAGRSLTEHYAQIQRGLTGGGGRVERAIPQALGMALAHTERTDRILIMGCGAGAEARFLLENDRPDIVGLDVFPELAALCRRDLGIETVVGDMSATGLEDRSFDVVLTHRSLHHLFYPFPALEEFARLARKRVIIVNEPAKTLIKRIVGRVGRRPVISPVNIYEYQFDPADVDRYMRFFAFDRLDYRRFWDASGHPRASRALNAAGLTGIGNRFSAAYVRVADPDR